MVCFFPTLGEDNLGLDPDAVKWLIWHSTVYFSVHVFINIWFSALLFTNIRVPSLQENDTFLACGLISDVTMWLASANKMLSRHAVWHWQAEAEDLIFSAVLSFSSATVTGMFWLRLYSFSVDVSPTGPRGTIMLRPHCQPAVDVGCEWEQLTSGL